MLRGIKHSKENQGHIPTVPVTALVPKRKATLKGIPERRISVMQTTPLAPDGEPDTGHLVGVRCGSGPPRPAGSQQETCPGSYRDMPGICAAGSELRGVEKEAAQGGAQSGTGDCWGDTWGRLRWVCRGGCTWR